MRTLLKAPKYAFNGQMWIMITQHHVMIQNRLRLKVNWFQVQIKHPHQFIIHIEDIEIKEQ